MNNDIEKCAKINLSILNCHIQLKDRGAIVMRIHVYAHSIPQLTVHSETGVKKYLQTQNDDSCKYPLQNWN